MKDTLAKLRLVGAMVIFGTIGLFVRFLGLPSGMVAFVRGAVGALVLLLIMALLRKRPSLAAVRRNLLPLLVSGAFVGFNWILLFEAYRYTTVSVATMCYYMAPIFVVIAAPLLLRERMTARRLACVVAALLGMLGVSGLLDNGLPGAQDAMGILFGLGAALLYAGVMLLNKRIREIDAYDKTVVQLGAAAVVILPYSLLVEGGSAFLSLQWQQVLLLLLVGVIHTGVAYFLYFGAMGRLPAQTTALLSYIDPAVALLLSVFVLQEGITLDGVIGAVLILGAALVSELPGKEHTKR